MFLNRIMVMDQIKLLNDSFVADDPEVEIIDVTVMSDDELISEYCLSGLFSDKYPAHEENEIEGLI